MAKRARSNNNWSKLKNRKYTETAQGRDVYNQQQIERGEPMQMQTMTSRVVGAVLLSVLAIVVVYGLIGFGSTVTRGFANTLGSIDRYDGKDGVNGECVYDLEVMEMATGEFRDRKGNLYEMGPDGKYIDCGETVAGRYGSDALVDVEAEPTRAPSFIAPEEQEAPEDAGQPEPWPNTSMYDTGNVSTIRVSRGKQVLMNLAGTEFYRDDSGRLYEIVDGAYALQVAENMNAYFKANPDKVPPERSMWAPIGSWQIIASLLVGFIVFAALYAKLEKNLKAQNMMADKTDINSFKGDQHIALPEEVQARYDWFPDVGAHSSVQVSSLISHVALQNKGINKIRVAKRYKQDVVDEDGNVVYYKGEIMRDDDDEIMYEEVPMFDEDFAEALFTASKADPEYHVLYDASSTPYNPFNKDRDKLTGTLESETERLKNWQKFLHSLKPGDLSMFKMVSDLINKDWTFPEYEPQRPAGAYIVDTAPVNTMVLAITRAGKGQTVIEPTIDCWTREKRGHNMVINDPKGELLVKFYARGTYRGYQVVQFNLVNSMKTDIYNPLGMAAQSAREGDFINCAQYVENIAEVFFPLDGGDDPVWPNAANNAFKRAAYGLIDFYLEEERKYRNECNARIAAGEYIDPQTIENEIDTMWGKVTLYNCYQMFTQMTSRKLPNPAVAFGKKMQALEHMEDGSYRDNKTGKTYTEGEIAAEADHVNKMAFLWNDAPEADCLSLYFNASDRLPRNSMRTLVSNANNALKAMAGAEKMLASCERLFDENHKSNRWVDCPANCMAEAWNDRVTPGNMLSDLRRAA